MEQVKSSSGALSSYVQKIRNYLDNEVLVTDFLTKLTITFGVMLIVSGLYLMLSNQSQSVAAVQSIISAVNWVPGIPFNTSELFNAGTSGIGLISWILGVDFLVLGLGFWVRNKLARWVGLMLFAVAAFFQLVQLLYVGILGSPTSIFELCIDGAFAYFLFSRFDLKKPSPLKLPNQ